MGALDYKTRRHRRTRMAAEMYATWTPRRLFTFGSSVGGAHWFDSPSLYPGGNHLYLYQDNAGTTPVTAVGQTIGLSLDRAYGGRTDGSLIASGATGLTGTATAASYNTSTGAGSVSRAGDASNQSWVTWTGLTTSATHRIRVTNTGATSLDVRNGGVAGTIVASIAAGATSYVHPLTSGGSTSITITATNNSTTATFTVVEFGRVPGTHLIQATGTARPTLSARVNLLLNSENFSNASWTKRSGGSVSATNSATAPNGTVTADTWLQSGTPGTTSVHSTTTVPASANLKHSISVKPISGQWVALAALDTSGTDGFTAWFDLTNGVKGTASTSGSGATLGAWNITPEANGFYRIDVSGIVGTDTSIWSCFLFVVTADGSTTRLADGSCYVWGADLRTADDAAKNIPAYQRVGATAADHDTDGFPHYALFDGTDDSWASTSTVDGSGSDKVTVVAGVTKNSDAASGCVVEHTATSASNNGAFILSAPTSASVYQWRSKGTAQSDAATAASYPAPSSVVLTGTGDIGADVSTLRIAGAQVASAATDQGTGNYANATTYVGSRAGSSLRFNGRIYSLVFRFGAMGEADRNRSEQWNKNLMRLP